MLKRTSCIFVIVIVNVIVIVTVIFTDSWAEIKFFVDFLAVMDIFTYICARF